MGSSFNFKVFDDDQLPTNLPLARQGSIYSLTFDEFQSTIGGGLRKDFGSMNMDELLKNIWSAEEMQYTGSAAGGGSDFPECLPRQGSLTLPRTLSQKTVDEVWTDISRGRALPMEAAAAQRQPTLGEITLEEFLVRAGIVRDDAVNTDANGKAESYFGMRETGSNSHSQPQIFPKLGGGYGGGCMPSDVTVKVPGDSPTAAPFDFTGNPRGRRGGNKVERVAERRQRRMIKNRESAARSRARKQAYTMELEAEVAKLKEENDELRRKEAELVKLHNRQAMEMKNAKQAGKRRLRRTHTGPW